MRKKIGKLMVICLLIFFVCLFLLVLLNLLSGFFLLWDVSSMVFILVVLRIWWWNLIFGLWIRIFICLIFIIDSKIFFMIFVRLIFILDGMLFILMMWLVLWMGILWIWFLDWGFMLLFVRSKGGNWFFLGMRGFIWVLIVILVLSFMWNFVSGLCVRIRWGMRCLIWWMGMCRFGRICGLGWWGDLGWRLIRGSFNKRLGNW